MKTFTLADAARHDGRNAPAYVIYKGNVYDVSGSFIWKDGSHQVLHHAGEDLTDYLKQAPHTEEMLKRFPVVGVLHKDDNGTARS